MHRDDINIGDGIGSDIANITDLVTKGAKKVLLPDPVYTLDKATSLMDGQEVIYLECNEENGFLPTPPDYAADMIYLCSPNNPTGATVTYEQLEKRVEYANKHNAVILYDAAYERFIMDASWPHFIYQLPGANPCAMTVRWEQGT